MDGWAGKILDIDLSSGSVKTVPLDEKVARSFVGDMGS